MRTHIPIQVPTASQHALSAQLVSMLPTHSNMPPAYSAINFIDDTIIITSIRARACPCTTAEGFREKKRQFVRMSGEFKKRQCEYLCD